MKSNIYLNVELNGVVRVISLGKGISFMRSSRSSQIAVIPRFNRGNGDGFSLNPR